MKGKRSHPFPITVEVVSTMLGIQSEECKNCQGVFASIGLKKRFADQEINEYPEDLKEEVLRLSHWIRQLARAYPDQILLKVIDAVSPLGVYKRLRHRIHEFPAFIIDHSMIHTGWNKQELSELLDQHLQTHKGRKHDDAYTPKGDLL